MFGEGAVPALVLVIASMVAAITDVWRFKVYNLLTIPLLLSGLAYHALTGGTTAFVGGFYGALFGLAIFVIPYTLGMVGAGDVKFIIGIGAWIGVPTLITVTLIGCIVTGFYSLGIMVYYGQFRATWINLKILYYRIHATRRLIWSSSHMADQTSVQEITKQPDRRHRLLPFSAMMTVGLVITLILRAWQ